MFRSKIFPRIDPNNQENPSISGDPGGILYLLSRAIDDCAIVSVTDPRGRITYANSRFSEISGFDQASLLGDTHGLLNSGLHPPAFFDGLYAAINKGERWTGEICNRGKGGSKFWVSCTISPLFSPAGEIEGYISVQFDITGQKSIEKQLVDMHSSLRAAVNNDYLTGLASRRKFYSFLEEELAYSNRRPRALHVALMDLDNFKYINDAFGHDAGDSMLKEVANRLRKLISNDCFIARLGGDEFAVVLGGIDVDEAKSTLTGIIDRLKAPIKIGSATHRCSASIGLCTHIPHEMTAEDLLKGADIALYRAKELGRNRMQIFDSKMRDGHRHRVELHRAVEEGLGRGELLLYYQPIVPVSCSARPSFEALLRWRHPTLGLISPFNFPNSFENPGLAWLLGDSLIRRVATDIRHLQDLGIEFDRMAINVTEADFGDEQFPDRLLRALADEGVASERICIEVTEGMFLRRGSEAVKRGLRDLHEAGAEIALDDFGTGFASLAHLRSTPFDRLKIDRSFVANAVSSQEDRAIVAGIIRIAHDLGKSVTAEGVETEQQAHLLADMGCDLLQGFLFSKAEPLERLPFIARSLATAPLRLSSALAAAI